MAGYDKPASPQELHNGPGAAAMLAAGIGAATVGLFALLRDAFAGVAHLFNFYGPTGPLSGVTTSAVAVWLIAWYALGAKWSERNVNIAKVSIAAFVLLAIGFALTFPPIMDVLQGK